MPEEFNKNKSHIENVKISIDNILGAKSKLKRQRKQPGDLKKDMFLSFIDSMISLMARSEEMHEVFVIDMTAYDEPFYGAMEYLMSMMFNKNQIDIIYFYVFHRITEDGKEIHHVDSTGKKLDISTPEKLWERFKELE